MVEEVVPDYRPNRKRIVCIVEDKLLTKAPLDVLGIGLDSDGCRLVGNGFTCDEVP